MKKLLTVLLIVIFAASFALAQRKSYRTYSDEDGALSVGAKFGLNFASVGGDNSSSYSGTTKIFFGGFMDYNIIKDFGVRGELLYNTTGTGIPNGDVSFSYLEIVALAKYNISVDPSVKIFFDAGPQLGIKLSANAHNNANSTDTDISSQVSGTDFDIVIGTGVSFKVGTGSIIADLRYNIGLSNLNKTSPPSNTNQVFSLGVGYAFSLR
jgi:hypothetical protein